MMEYAITGLIRQNDSCMIARMQWYAVSTYLILTNAIGVCSSFAWLFLCGVSYIFILSLSGQTELIIILRAVFHFRKLEAAWMIWHWLFHQLAYCIFFAKGVVSKISSSWKKLTQAENPSFKNNVNLWWKHHGKEVQWESLTVFPSTRALTNGMAWQELSVSGMLRCELRGQHLHLQQCELPWTQFRWTAVKCIAAFWAQMMRCQLFLEENIHNGIFAQKWHFDQQSTSSSHCDIASDRCTAYSILSF